MKYILALVVLFGFFAHNAYSVAKEYVEVKSGEKKLTGIIHTDKKDAPVIYFIQGYTCMSIDGLPEKWPYNQLIASFLESGYSVFQLEKSGFGKVENQKPCSEIGYNEEVSDFEAGYQYLINELKIPESKIFIFGHSMGGSIAAAIAAKNQPAGVAAYGSGIRSWYEYLLDVTRYQGIWNGRDYEANGALLQQLAGYYFRWLHDGETLENICKDTTAARIFDDLWGYEGKGNHFLGRHENFFKELNAVNHYAHWKNVKCPVLSLYGEADVETLYPDDMRAIAEIVNHYRPGTATFITLRETDHLFAKVGTVHDVIRLRNEKNYGKAIYEQFNIEAPKTITDFFNQCLKP